MERRESVRQGVGIAVDLLGGNVDRPALVVANPFQGQLLAVPRDVRLGDTPEGEPAIFWTVPGWISRDTRSPDYARVDWAAGAPADQAIWAFLQLASESDPEQFVDFTRQFGPLGLWHYTTGKVNEKGQKIRIFELGDAWVPSIVDGIQTPHRYLGHPLPGYEHLRLDAEGLLGMRYEPIEKWRWWARRLRAVVQIAVALRLGELGAREDWAVLGIEGDRFTPYARDPIRQRRHLTRTMQFWFLKWSGLVPVFRWSGDHPSLELAFGGDHAVTIRRASGQQDWPENALFPALVASLLAIVTAGSPVAECSLCGAIHPRDRKPRSDQPAYCQQCRDEAKRANKRRSAAKARAMKRAKADDNSDDNSGRIPANVGER